MRPVSVLIVDDDPAFAELSATFLSRARENLNVATETDPRAVVDRLRTDSVDCIVTDYDMPHLTGLDLLAEVREYDSDVPFILFTGKGSEEIASEAVSRGVTDYLQKRTGQDQYAVLANRIANTVQQARSAAALRASERRYRRLFEASPAPTHIFTADRVIRSANHASAQLFDADDPADLVGRRIDEFVYPEDREEADKRFRTLFEDRETVPETEQRVRSLDGELKYTVVTTTPITYEDAPAAQATAYDFTERHRAERRLKAHKQTVAALHEAALEISNAGTPDEVYRLAVDLASGVLSFDRCGVDTVEGESLRSRAVSDDLDETENLAVTSIHDGVAGQTARERRSIIVDDLRGDPRSHSDVYRSVLSVPIADIGVFQAVSTEVAAFDDDDRELAELLVAHVANRVRQLAEADSRIESVESTNRTK